MKKRHFLISVLAIIMIVLTACGGDNDSSTGKKSKKGKAKGFKEVESFETEFPVLRRDFNLDETGKILFWGEDNNSRNRDQPSYVWVDGDKKSLDSDLFSSNAFLFPSGKIISVVTDRDKPKGEQISIMQYDPKTDTDTEDAFIPDDDIDVITLHAGPGKYLEDPKTYVHTVSNTDREDAETFIWDIEKDTFNKIPIIKKIKEAFGDNKLPSYPHFTFTNDASTIYASVLNVGLFAYDVASESLESLVENEAFLPREDNTSMLTADEKHFIYAVNDSTDDELIITVNAINLETKEIIEIGTGSKIFTLTDGNVIIVDEEEVKHFDFEKEKLDTIHTIELKDNQKLDNVTVSTDGKTIAYGHTDKGEDDKEDVSHMTILQSK